MNRLPIHLKVEQAAQVYGPGLSPETAAIDFVEVLSNGELDHSTINGEIRIDQRKLCRFLTGEDDLDGAFPPPIDDTWFFNYEDDYETFEKKAEEIKPFLIREIVNARLEGHLESRSAGADSTWQHICSVLEDLTRQEMQLVPSAVFFQERIARALVICKDQASDRFYALKQRLKQSINWTDFRDLLTKVQIDSDRRVSRDSDELSPLANDLMTRLRTALEIHSRAEVDEALLGIEQALADLGVRTVERPDGQDTIFISHERVAKKLMDTTDGDGLREALLGIPEAEKSQQRIDGHRYPGIELPLGKIR